MTIPPLPPHSGPRTTAAVIPMTGAQYPIEAGEYAAVATELGAGLRELLYRGSPVITGYPPDEIPPAGAGQLLIPWPNRVDGGRYTVAGARYQLDLSEPAHGNAIHGLTRWLPWTAVRHTSAAVALRTLLPGQPGYPFCLDIEVEYRLDAGLGLRVSVTTRNAGSRPAPYGTGSHPYLTLGVPTVDECDLRLPCSRWLPTDERGIPVGATEDVAGTRFDFRGGRTIGDTQLDHALTGLDRDGNGLAWARLTGAGTQVSLWAGPGYGWLQVFTGDALGPSQRRRALAIEPMTCPPNAFVSGTDLLMLDPGATVTHTWGIQVTAHG